MKGTYEENEWQKIMSNVKEKNDYEWKIGSWKEIKIMNNFRTTPVNYEWHE